MSGVVVDGAGAGVGFCGAEFTGGEVEPRAGGGAAVLGVEGTAPADDWFIPAGAVAAVLTPAPVALGEVTGCSGEAVRRALAR